MWKRKFFSKVRQKAFQYLQEVGILEWQGMVWFLYTGQVMVECLDDLRLWNHPQWIFFNTYFKITLNVNSLYNIWTKRTVFFYDTDQTWPKWFISYFLFLMAILLHVMINGSLCYIIVHSNLNCTEKHISMTISVFYLNSLSRVYYFFNNKPTTLFNEMSVFINKIITTSDHQT